MTVQRLERRRFRHYSSKAAQPFWKGRVKAFEEITPILRGAVAVKPQRTTVQSDDMQQAEQFDLLDLKDAGIFSVFTDDAEAGHQLLARPHGLGIGPGLQQVRPGQGSEKLIPLA